MVSEKNLTELEWKKFSRGQKYEDKDFLKALAALEAGAKSKDVPARQKALDDIQKQAAKLRAANKSDKGLLNYLDELEKELPGQRKLLEMEAAAGGPDLLPMLREVGKGGVMQAMVAISGKTAAVLLSRRALGASQKQVLTTELGVSSGVKIMEGECIWEANAHTFVLEAKVAELAKLIKACLLKKTGQRFKVRVRGSDPNDVDDDGDEHEGAEAEGQEAGSGESDDKALYQARLAELQPRIAAAQASGAADAAKIKALATFAQGKATEGKFKAALQGLDAVAKLLSGSNAPKTAAKAPSRPVLPIWTAASDEAIDQATGIIVALRKLGDESLDRMADDLLDTLNDHLSGLNEMLEEYDVLNADERAEFAVEALDIVHEHQRNIASDPLIKAADNNPFQLKLDLGKTLGAALDKIAAEFAA